MPAGKDDEGGCQPETHGADSNQEVQDDVVAVRPARSRRPVTRQERLRGSRESAKTPPEDRPLLPCVDGKAPHVDTVVHPLGARDTLTCTVA